ncbi:MAG: winged helix-turn-helix transcriptional regulator [Bacteroidetes bacterium]|nr:winged helix-turn-helix transcriptional regulator [Bacteroidota bacterium]NCQ12068.1 winged helix-turn-helix transcriptional regulator [Bacteroidota bacterium]
MSRTLAPVSFTSEDIQLAAFAKAFAHPVRLNIIRILNEQACCYNGDLTEIIPLAQSTISQHLKVLVDAGLIKGEILPPKIKYCLNHENWNKAKTLFSQFLAFKTAEATCNSTC